MMILFEYLWYAWICILFCSDQCIDYCGKLVCLICLKLINRPFCVMIWKRDLIPSGRRNKIDSSEFDYGTLWFNDGTISNSKRTACEWWNLLCIFVLMFDLTGLLHVCVCFHIDFIFLKMNFLKFIHLGYTS
jgi:hypothetical protein